MRSSHAHKHHTAHKKQVAKKAAPKRLVDRIIYVTAFVEPLFSLPQAYTIFHTQSASGVSIPSWLGFEVMTAIWIWYSIVHRDKLLIIYQGLYFIIDGAVVIGALMYGGAI